MRNTFHHHMQKVKSGDIPCSSAVGLGAVQVDNNNPRVNDLSLVDCGRCFRRWAITCPLLIPFCLVHSLPTIHSCVSNGVPRLLSSSEPCVRLYDTLPSPITRQIVPSHLPGKTHFVDDHGLFRIGLPCSPFSIMRLLRIHLKPPVTLRDGTTKRCLLRSLHSSTTTKLGNCPSLFFIPRRASSERPTKGSLQPRKLDPISG